MRAELWLRTEAIEHADKDPKETKETGSVELARWQGSISGSFPAVPGRSPPLEPRYAELLTVNRDTRHPAGI